MPDICSGVHRIQSSLPSLVHPRQPTTRQDVALHSAQQVILARSGVRIKLGVQRVQLEQVAVWAPLVAGRARRNPNV